MSAATAIRPPNLFWLFLHRSPGTLGFAVAAGVASGLSTTALIAVINLWLKEPARRGPALVWVFAGLCVLRLAAGFGCHIVLIRLSQNALYDLRAALCRTILNAPLRQLELAGQDRLWAAFTEDLNALANVVVNLPYMFVNVIVLAGCLLYLGWLSVPMLLGIVAGLLLGALSYLVPVLQANRRLRGARASQERLFEHFRGLSEGVKQLKLDAPKRQAFLERVLLPAAAEVRAQNVAGTTIYSLAANWNRMLFFVYVGVLLLFAPTLVPRGGPELAGYILVLLYMMAPLEAIMNALPHVAQAHVALGHIKALEASLQAAGTDAGTAPLAQTGCGPNYELRLEGVSFSYRDSQRQRQFELGPLDLTLRTGEVVFVTGGNGSGKTTLAKLIGGLYTPERGRLWLNGEAIEAANLADYRRHISVVFSDFYLFDALLGLEHSGAEARARQYLKQLELDHEVTLENGAFSTTSLSQGQRKRLALLGALLEDKPIFIFDEWAAHQDARFKHVFYERILPDLKARGKLVLAITHDTRYFAHADRLVKLDDGKLAAQAHHEPFAEALSWAEGARR